MKKLGWLACLITLSFASPLDAQSIIYGATGASGVNGQIYTMNVTTGVIDPSSIHDLLNASGLNPIGLTGMAFNPTNGTLYGVTNSASPNLANHLVTINPTTGRYTDIGTLGSGIKLSDISFKSDGTLYGYEGGGTDNGIPRRLFTIALTGINAGKATSAGANDLTVTSGGGLAFSLSATADGRPAGTLYLSATGTNGTLDRLSLTGTRTVGVTLTDGLFFGMGALAFDASGTLWGADNNGLGQPAVDVSLETINLVTGAIGGPNSGQGWDLMANTDAIAFAPIPEPSTGALLIFASAMSTVFVLRKRS